MEVSPALKQRFSDWIDARTAIGVAKYGEPLRTDNGRDAEKDGFEELLDFCQYQEQSRQELKARVAELEQAIREYGRGVVLAIDGTLLRQYNDNATGGGWT